MANGDVAAVDILWEEYFERVVKLARNRILARQRRVTDEEDVAVLDPAQHGGSHHRGSVLQQKNNIQLIKHAIMIPIAFGPISKLSR